MSVIRVHGHRIVDTVKEYFAAFFIDGYSVLDIYLDDVYVRTELYEKIKSIVNDTSGKSLPPGTNLPAFHYLYGRFSLLGYGCPENHDLAIKSLILAQNEGNAEASYELYRLFLKGEIVEKNLPEAKKCLQKSCDLGYYEALYALAHWYQNGNDELKIKVEMDKALELYQRSHDAGCAYGAFALGVLYDFALPEAQRDEEKAFQYYCEAVYSDIKAAYLNLASIYLREKSPHYDFKKGWDYLLFAAQNGDIIALRRVGLSYYFGNKEVKTDYKLAFTNLEKAAGGKDAEAWNYLGECYFYGRGIEKNREKAYECYLEASKLGYQDALYNLAFCCHFGYGTTKNDKLGFDYALKSAKTGSISGMVLLADYYYFGYWTAKNDKEAVIWCQKAFDGGERARSPLLLGYCYFVGDGVPLDKVKANDYYKAGAANGSGACMYNLGMNYANGEGIAQNFYEAVKWFEKGIEAGDVDCYYGLGLCYERGQGVLRLFSSAKSNYEKGAELGNGLCLNALGIFAWNEEKYDEAFRWFMKSAQAGCCEGQFSLGDCYEKGKGTSVNIATAVAYYKQAAANGSKEAIARLRELKISGY